jgi:hypothetical protein
MLGISPWILVVGVLSACGLLGPLLLLRKRPWTYRLLMGLGLWALIWGVAPAVAGRGMNQYLVVGAIIAFGFLILSDALGRDDAAG